MLHTGTQHLTEPLCLTRPLLVAMRDKCTCSATERRRDIERCLVVFRCLEKRLGHLGAGELAVLVHHRLEGLLELVQALRLGHLLQDLAVFAVETRLDLEPICTQLLLVRVLQR